MRDDDDDYDEYDDDYMEDDELWVNPSDGAIKQCAYQDRRDLVKVRIADGVTSIGYRAFEGCVNLVSIVIPLSVQIIGNNVFKDCANLATIAIPDSVTDLGGDAFAGCTALTVIDVFDGEKQPVSFRTELENGKQCNLNAWLGANNGKSNMSMARNFVSPIVATFLKFEPPLTGRPLQLVTRGQVGASKAARPVAALFDRWRAGLEGAEINPPKIRAGGAKFPRRF